MEYSCICSILSSLNFVADDELLKYFDGEKGCFLRRSTYGFEYIVCSLEYWVTSY